MCGSAASAQPSTAQSIAASRHSRFSAARVQEDLTSVTDLVTLPGSGAELCEYIEDCGVREVKEETGLDMDLTRLVGIYTNPHHVMKTR